MAESAKPRTRSVFRSRILWGLLSAAAAALIWFSLPGRVYFYTDAERIREPAAQAPLRDILWQPPQAVDFGVSLGGEVYEPRLSPDGLTLFFVRGKASSAAEGGADIWQSRRTHAGWTPPQPLAGVNSPADDLGPEISADGRALYFYSNREGGQGGYDLWVATRPDESAEFAEAVNLGPAINSSFNEYGPALCPDQRTLYFASNRPRHEPTEQPAPDAWKATVREDLFQRTYDLYVVPVDAETEYVPAPVTALNTDANEGSPALSPSGDFLYFSSDRPGGQGGFDLYRVRRIDGALSSAVNLGAAINTPANDLDPALSMGGFALHFSSDRCTLSDADAPAYQLFQSNSREVFLDAESRRAAIDWGAVWGALAPNLLWALLALLLILLLLATLRASRDRRLSLLARCLLTSLALHALLMLLFTVWHVAAAVTGLGSRKGEIKVALAGPSASALTSQLRGSLPDVSPPVVLASLASTDPGSLSLPHPQLAPMADAVPPTIQVEYQASAVESNLADAPLRPAAPAVRPVDARVVPPTSMPFQAPSEVESSHEPEPTSPLWKGALQARAPAPVAIPLSDEGRQWPEQASPPLLQSLSEPMPARGMVQVADAALPAPKEVQITFSSGNPHPSGSLELSLPAVAAPTANEEVVSPAPSLPAAAVETDEWTSPPPVPQVFDAAIPNAEPTVSIPEPAASAVRPVADAPELTGAASQHLTIALTVGQHVRELPLHVTGLEQAPRAYPQEAAPEPARDVVAPLAGGLDRPTALGGNPPPIVLPTLNSEIMVPAMPATSQSPSDQIDFRDSLAEAPAGIDRSPWPLSFRAQTPIAAPRADLPLAFDFPTAPAEIESPPSPVRAGRIHGKVVSIRSGEPVAGAEVRLDIDAGSPVTVQTDARGYYAMDVPPELPDFFALSASASSYLPNSVNVASRRLRGDGVRVNFRLRPESSDMLAIEAVPDVHHLGDNRFGGQINSQFQKRSEGRRFRASFVVSQAQLDGAADLVTLQLLAKGVQTRHRLSINDQPLRRRLDSAPSDGSFGEFSAEFPKEFLHPGENHFEVYAGALGDDVDDFEFVNVQIHLRP